MVENKYCSLYVSDMHLIVMLIPYIEKELEKGSKIVTILENSLEDEINTFMDKINLGKSKKNNIKKIRWNKNLLSEEQIGEIRGKIVLVKGEMEFIDNVNRILNESNKIINCYKLDEFEQNSREVLENHEAILNTLGVRKISGMFQTNKMMGIK